MYNVPKVSLEIAVETAVMYLDSGIIPLLISPPGVGKTESAERIAKAMGAKLRTLRLNTIPAEEAVGLQFVETDKETGAQRTVHLPPKWVPNPDGSDGPVLVFMDEYTQAPDDFRKGVMSALLERYLGDTRIADNCYFLAAGNSTEDGTNVYELDRATAERFGIICIQADVETWCNNYAQENNLEMSIVSFLRVRPDAFETSEEVTKSDKVVGTSPRTWVRLDRFLKTFARANPLEENGKPSEYASSQVFRTGVMGVVGEEMGTAFLSVYSEIVNLKAIALLLDMSVEKQRENTPKTIDALWAYCQGAIWYAKTEERIVKVFRLFDSFKEIKDIPFFETRFNVAETILRRARSKHGLNVTMNADLRHFLKRWKQQVDGDQDATPDLEEAEDAEDNVIPIPRKIA